MEEAKQDQNQDQTKPKRLSQQDFLAMQAQGKIDRKIMKQVKNKVYQQGNFSILYYNK